MPARAHLHESRVDQPCIGRWSLLLALLAAVDPATAIGQTIHRDNYYSSIPPTPAIIGQTSASERFGLYGDRRLPGYTDRAPLDGVDDRRGIRLLELAEHFSPILRRNTLMVPREFEEVLDADVLVHLDVWQDHVRVDSAVVRLGPKLVGSYATASEESGSNGMVPPDDAILHDLLRNLSPRRGRPGVRAPLPTTDTILFFDVPGEGDFTWRPEHGRREPEGSRIYAHPFIHQVPGVEGDRSYEFLIQFWFYYPYNDAANNHEGDWEHITVSITTHERARQDVSAPRERRGLLSAADVLALLDDQEPTPLDSLQIRNVAYYFHNNVMVLDYLAVAAGETLWRRANSNDGSIHIWEDTRYMDNAVLRRMYDADGRLATHPIGYIGGNSKGLDELLQMWPRFLGSYNRDSHGTYPFPGVWHKVGPVEATEKIYGDVLPRLHLTADGTPDPSLPWYDLLDDDRYLVYRADDIILLPDWERLEPLVLENSSVRRAWAWFLLPIHLGFPATDSPGGGALKRVDLGNVAPMGPAYNSAWNRPGATAVYPLYQPTVLRVALAPISPLTSLQSGWGIFNIPIVLWGLLPGGNVAITQLLPWVTGGMHLLGSPPAKTFTLTELPERFTSFSGGGFRQFGGGDFARLLPQPDDPAVREHLGVPDGTALRAVSYRRTPEWGSRVWIHLHYGARLSIENSFGYGVTTVSYGIENDAGQGLSELRGTLFTRELTGGVTYRLPPLESEFLRLYARAGYAWTSYSLTHVTIDGSPVEEGGLRGGRLPKLWPSRSWWPNTAYAGVGAEVFTPPRLWLLGRVGYGARLEVSGLLHRLVADRICQGCRVTAERGDAAFMLLFGW